MKMKSVMQHKFSEVPSAQIPRSVFNRSHAYKTTFDSAYLIPFYVDEALPGDTHNLKATLFARMATPAVPFMDNLYLDVFYFAVPIRLIWDNFQKFMGERVDPDDSIDYEVPQVVADDVDGFTEGSLFDYFGLPIDVVDLSVSAFWSRAYNLIWNEWFRDQNLQDSVTVDKGDAADDPADYVLLKRGKKHDYFTSCLPWPQKGDAVPLPLGDAAPVEGLGKLTNTWDGTDRTVYETGGTGTVVYDSSRIVSDADTGQYFYVEEDVNNSGFPGVFADCLLVLLVILMRCVKRFKFKSC